MSRDPGPGRGGRDERAAELLAAYVDGVGELPPDERRRVEALLERDPGARAEQAMLRGLIEDLRALPPGGGGGGGGDGDGSEGVTAGEPDWAALERSIRDAVGREVPRPWWRRWSWWLAPSATLATALAVLLVLWRRPGMTERMLEPPAPIAEHAAPLAPPAVPGDHDLVPLWLDGAEVDVDGSASALLGDAMAARAIPSLPDPASDDDELSPTGPADPELALLPPADLAWIDRLDDDALARAEHWLASAGSRKKG
ncbi:MAG TPA: hypothetical protein VFK02_28530 [Kofleriaceae bacterium]|nr:hypothetical protein [Kofleriaceae bacterium]